MTGRFNQLDPFAGDITSPQSLHKYGYVSANPVNSIDPAGLSSLGELQSVSSIMTRLMSFTTRISRIVNTASNVADAIETIYSLLRIFSASGRSQIQQGINRLVTSSLSDPDFAAVLSQRGFENAVNTFTANSGRILASLIQNSMHERFRNAMATLNDSDSRLLIFMPTPYATGIPNPLLVLPTGLKLKLGPVRARVSLYFGAGEMRGRYFGVGMVADQSQSQLRKPYQLFRMDWHDPLGHGPGKALDAWQSGDFHFHVLDQRKRVSKW